MLLLRDRASPEVLLLRRHAKMRTFRNIWVFPGGQLDPADRSDAAEACVAPALRERCVRSLLAGRAADDPLERRDALGLWVAACRETYEEAGILLARREDGGAPDARQRERFRARRAALASDAPALFAALREESLVFDVNALVCWARWVTPRMASSGFDTSFFAAALPPGAAVDFDTGEANESLWLDPASISAEHQDDNFVLAPPTFVSLMDLARAARAHGDTAAVLRAECARRIVPIQPKVASVAGAWWGVFPWDPEFPRLEGESLSRPGELPAAYQGLPTRLPAPAELRIG